MPGAMPWNYFRFFDYATEHILLRKVDSGYIFVSRAERANVIY
jgi:hypothetical protein